MGTLNRFDEWLKSAAKAFSSRGFSIEITRSNEEVTKPSLGMMLSSNDTLGQLTIWDDGECFQEVGCLESGVVIFCRHSKIDEETSLDIHFSDFLSFLFRSDGE